MVFFEVGIQQVGLSWFRILPPLYFGKGMDSPHVPGKVKATSIGQKEGMVNPSVMHKGADYHGNLQRTVLSALPTLSSMA